MTNTDLLISRDRVRSLSAALKDTDWYARRRLAAWKVLQATPLPTQTDEPWRRTSLKGFRWAEAVLPPYTRGKRPVARALPVNLTRSLTDQPQGGQLTLASGKVVTRRLAPALKRQNVIFTDFLTATRQHPALVKKYLGRGVNIAEGKFAALAEAMADGGMLVYVPAGVQAALPLHFVTWLTNPAHFTRILIVLEAGASATVVQEWSSPGGRPPTLHAATVEVIVGPNAQLNLVELQTLGTNTWNFAHERVRLGRDSSVNWVFAATGSQLTKNFTEVSLEGEGASARVSGFYFADGHQHFDHDTQQNHLVPHTTSDLLFKGVVKDQSHSVWQGMIYVAPGAQKTDGYQANRNLVLSESARADSLPGLEILNDDVRCSHGATVGQLEEEHIFYLMSRGLTRAQAEKLTVSGFFEPVLDRIPFEGVRQRLRKAIEEKMK